MVIPPESGTVEERALCWIHENTRLFHILVSLVILLLVLSAYVGLVLLKEEEGEEWEWRRSLDEEVLLTHYVFPYDPVVVVEKEIIDPAFAYTESGAVYALDFEDGETLWKLDFGSSFTLQPVVYLNALYVFVEDDIISLEPLTGAENWRFTVPDLAEMEPSFHQGCIAVVSGENTVYSISTAGELNWRMILLYTLWKPPAVNDHFLVTTDSYHIMYCYNLSDGEIVADRYMIAPLLWQQGEPCDGYQLATNRVGGGWLYQPDNEDLVIIRSGVLVKVLHAENGSEYWSHRFSAHISWEITLLYWNFDYHDQHVGGLFVSLENNTIVRIGENGLIRWFYECPGVINLPVRLSARVVVTDEFLWNIQSTEFYLFVGTGKRIHILDAETGQKVDRIKSKYHVDSLTLSIRRVILSGGSRVVCYENEYASPADTSNTPRFACCGTIMVAMVAPCLVSRGKIIRPRY